MSNSLNTYMNAINLLGKAGSCETWVSASINSRISRQMKEVHGTGFREVHGTGFRSANDRISCNLIDNADKSS